MLQIPKNLTKMRPGDMSRACCVAKRNAQTRKMGECRGARQPCFHAWRRFRGNAPILERTPCFPLCLLARSKHASARGSRGRPPIIAASAADATCVKFTTSPPSCGNETQHAPAFTWLKKQRTQLASKCPSLQPGQINRPNGRNPPRHAASYCERTRQAAF